MILIKEIERLNKSIASKVKVSPSYFVKVSKFYRISLLDLCIVK